MIRSLALLSILAASATTLGQGYLFPFESEADRAPLTITNGNCVIRAGKVLTVTNGVLTDVDILVRAGKIVQIGKGLAVPAGFKEIDARNRVLMPGIVDAHVHRGADATNEGSDAITAEVRVRDVLDSTKKNVWQAVASGETSALILHGSANPIGGESVVVKLKYRRPNAELPIPDAPRMVKFALGENVTRASSTTSTRFPNSRMGVEAVYRRAFTEAQKYMAVWDAYEKNPAGKVRPRRDVRLEALSDILRGRIWVQCHSYRADEILMMAKLSKEFGFRIGAMQHALEAYKIAPELAELGVPVSMFSDHWGYKLEAYDAIPAGPTICYRAGVLTSINTDGTSGVSAIILDAAKQIRNGLTENEALRTLTINPATQLGISHRVGSIEVGKDADFSIWDGHPFSVFSKCQMTMIEGEVFFERRDKFGVGISPAADHELKVPARTKPIAMPKLGERYAIVGGTVYPVSGPPIKGGTVVVDKGRITAVGTNVSIPSGTVRIDAKGLSVYPGMIDAGTALGLSEISPIPVSVDLSESGDFQADLVAATAVQRDSAHISNSLTHGITAFITRPGGSLVSGQASLMSSWGWNHGHMTREAAGGLVINVPAMRTGGRPQDRDAGACACTGPSLQEIWDGIPHDHQEEVLEPLEAIMLQGRGQGGFGGQGGGQPEDLVGRMKTLSDYFARAKAYADNPPAPGTSGVDLGLAAMKPYVTGQRPVLLRCRNVDSIRNAISLAKSHNLKAILVGANEAWRIASEVKASGYPVLLTMQGESTLGAVTPDGPYDPYDTPYVLPKLLADAGIKVGFQSEDNTLSFMMPQRVGIYGAYGSSEEALLRGMTLSTAEIFGVEKELGSLEPGKRADLFIANGSPLETTTTVLGVMVGGRMVPMESRQTMLRDRYMPRLDPMEEQIRRRDASK